MKRIFILLTPLSIFTITSCEQTATIPAEFVETIPPKVASDEWFLLNHSQNEFGVKIINGKLDIKKVKEVHKSELKISGGTLVGINRGE